MCEEKNATMKSSVADIEDAIRQLAEYQSEGRGEEQVAEDAERQRDLVIAVLESVRRAMNGDESFILPVEIPEDAFDIDLVGQSLRDAVAEVDVLHDKVGSILKPAAAGGVVELASLEINDRNSVRIDPIGFCHSGRLGC